jgi:DNA-binding SARP family transcriptional activator
MEPTILVLGPIAIRGTCGAQPIVGERARRLLATLTVSVNRPVTIDMLVDAVWGESPPTDPHRSTHSMVTRLRRVCEPDAAIVLEDHSYRLAVDGMLIDACLFEHLARQAVDAKPTDPGSAGKLARRALGLWRGPAYGDLASRDPFRLEAIRLEEMRISTAESLVESELAAGRTLWTVPMLRSMLEESPYREHLWELLIIALGAAGRRADAVEAYRSYATTMAGIGLSPDPIVSGAHERVKSGSMGHRFKGS